MRRVLVIVALLLGVTPVARAQQQAPLEDVVLQGRILRPDRSPLANTPVRVDARKATSGFAIFSFVFTGGLSTLSCFDPNSEACILPNTKRFSAVTDAEGRYRFVFPKAKRQGEQTNTDYFLSVGMPSRRGGDAAAIAQYELELLTAVHNAPDLVVWDPAASVKAGERAYDLVYERRPGSKNNVQAFVDQQQTSLISDGSRTIEARDLEDNTVSLVPFASEDRQAEGTIYHQRFTGAPVALRGAVVPLSRDAQCGVTLTDGTNVTGCGFTDGDIVTPGRKPNADEPAVSAVTIDLRAARKVAEVRARGCACTFEGSSDGTTWTEVPGGRTFNAKSLRFVRAKGELASTAEVSVWGPWDDEAAAPPPPAEPGSPAPTPLLPPGAEDAVPRVLYVIAVAALAFAAYKLNKAQLTSR